MTHELYLGRDVSRETSERLDHFVELLKKWSKSINLVSRSTMEHVWHRHIADSAQIWPLAPKEAQIWADLGSGGGLPGMVIAILAHELRPSLRVTLVESDLRKSAFLSTASRELGLTTNVLAKRIEEVPPLGADVVSARALAPLDRLLPLAARHLGENGVGLFPKGVKHVDELAAALASWRFTHETYKSETESEAVIYKIGGLSRA